MSTNLDFPTPPGYALGGLITHSNLYLPYHQKEYHQLHDKLAKLEQSKNESLKKEGDQQKIINAYAIAKISCQQEMRVVAEKLRKCFETSSSGPIQWTQPFYERYAKIRSVNNIEPLEHTAHLHFTRSEEVLPQIRSFVAQLFLEDASSTFLPPGTLESIAESIKTHLGSSTDNAMVTVIASLIRLPRVKLISPLRLRPTFRLNDELKQNLGAYYALSEAALGAVFLGVGTHHPSSKDQWKSSAQLVSLISLGAFSMMPPNSKEEKLWTVYSNWKNAVLNDPKSGFPIGFKATPLQDVLAENQIFLT